MRVSVAVVLLVTVAVVAAKKRSELRCIKTFSLYVDGPRNNAVIVNALYFLSMALLVRRYWQGVDFSVESSPHKQHDCKNLTKAEQRSRVIIKRSQRQ